MRTFIHLLLCVLAAAFMTTGCSSGNSPKGVAKAFDKYIFIKDDFDSAMELVEQSPEFALVRDKLPNIIQEAKKTHNQNGGLKKISIERVDFAPNDPDTCTVYVILTCKNGFQHTPHLTMRKTGKRWKIVFQF